MKKYLALLMFLSLAQWGCAFLGGAATGALATGAGYEINSKRQMDKLEMITKTSESRVESTKTERSRLNPVRLYIEPADV